MGLAPSDHVYTIQQNHGPNDGGWGTAGVSIMGAGPTLVIYAGDDPVTIMKLKEATVHLAKITGKETRLCLYTNREDILVAGRVTSNGDSDEG